MDIVVNTRNENVRQYKVLLVGCPIDSGNGGVTALGYSAIANLIRHEPNIAIYIQNNTGNINSLRVGINGISVELKPVFFHYSTKYTETQGLRLSAFIAHWADLMPRAIRNLFAKRIQLLAAIDQVDAVLDVSGGDSFTSIYGEGVFSAISAIKNIAYHYRKPLYLLPQSYGPFLSDRHSNTVRTILDYARIIGCRDAHGKLLVTNLSPGINQAKIIDCPDMAFGMESDRSITKAVRARHKDSRVLGLNVSGLLYFQTEKFHQGFNYRDLIHRYIEWVIRNTDAVVLLISHVVSTKKQHLVRESTDREAIDDVATFYPDMINRRIFLSEDYSDPRKVKGVIGACDYFVGARMHACIGAISQGVDTKCLAYSDKFLGVMRMARMEHTVVDLRQHSLKQVLKQIQFEPNMADRPKIASDELSILNSRVELFFKNVFEDLAELHKAG